MGVFKNQGKQKQTTIDKAQRTGTDKRIYGDLIYRCRRCGYEGKIENVPDIDKVAYALIRGNGARVFMTSNFYQDENTGAIYKESMEHECDQGRYGFMELIGADIKGQIFLADKYKTHDYNSNTYNPDDEIPLEDLFN